MEPQKLESLRKAVQVGLDQIERGEFVEFESDEELDRFLDQIEDGVLPIETIIASHRAAAKT